MSVTTFDDVKGHNPDNQRKILEMAIFVKAYDPDSTPVDSIWDGAGLVLPEGLIPVGLTTKADGGVWSRAVEFAETESHGYSEPTRRDALKAVRGLRFTAQETNRATLELYNSLDLSGVTLDQHGGFFFDDPSRPVSRRWEVWAIGKDGYGPDAVYVARVLPNADVTETADQAWKEDEVVHYPCTTNGKLHTGWGTAFREMWGGPGLDAAAMGIGTTTP